MIRVVTLTSELDAGAWVPVVRHEFFGQTLGEAFAVYQAHLRTDAFLAACTAAGRAQFDGITCETRVWFEAAT
jgi:hypothetical protein